MISVTTISDTTAARHTTTTNHTSRYSGVSVVVERRAVVLGTDCELIGKLAVVVVVAAVSTDTIPMTSKLCINVEIWSAMVYVSLQRCMNV